MKYYLQSANCLNCHAHINEWVHDYSIKTFDISLCIQCQEWYKVKLTQTTKETIGLYFLLKERGVPASLELLDGDKAIDIAVEDAKVNIEVEGPQHNFDCKQALSGLQRAFHAFKKGFLTLRIPNSLVRKNLEETADYITAFLNLNKGKIRSAS